MVTYNRRRHRRVTAKGLTIQLESDTGMRPCIVENLSTGGVFLRTSELSPVGSEIDLTVTRPGMKKPIRIRGRVASALDTQQLVGMGVEFRSVDPDDVARLASLLVELGAVEGKAPAMPRQEVTTLPGLAPREGVPAARAVAPGPPPPPPRPAGSNFAEKQVKTLQEELAKARAVVEEKDKQLARFRAELDRVRLELKTKDDQLARLGAKAPRL
ncbi:MAG: PilZ domain-containing protein [Myxococcaceae bacterium]